MKKITKWLGVGTGLSALSIAAAVSLPPTTLPGVLPPAHIRPMLAKVNSQLDLILIEDKVANSQYLSTIASSGDIVAGSLPQALFGARNPGLGAKKPAVWYTHKADKRIVEINQLSPAQAFRGFADEHGAAVGWGGGNFKPSNGRQVNPVLSEMAFAQFAQAGLGMSRQLSFTEQAADGRQREFQTTVTKRAQLILNPAMGKACRDEVVQGVAGKVCTLRTISGQSTAVNGGDLMFTVRAKMAPPSARFKVGSAWHRVGESIPIAEFARSRSIEVFFVPPSAEQKQAWQAAHPKQRLADLVEVGFYSASRLSRGDRFNLQLFGAELKPERNTILSRLGLLVIDDQATEQQYVTTLSGRAGQAIYGAVQEGGQNRAATWYVENGRQQALFPLTQARQALPLPLFAGFSDASGQVSRGKMAPLAGQVNPVFSQQAFEHLVQQPVGAQQQLTLDGSRSNGDQVSYHAHVVKSASLQLSRPQGSACRPETVEGVEGQICVLRTIKANNQAQSGGDIRFGIRSKLPLPNARFRVDDRWHRMGESVAVSEFAQSKAIEVFFAPPSAAQKQAWLSALPRQKLSGLVEAGFYSASRRTQGDVFLLGAGAGFLASLTNPRAVTIDSVSGDVVSKSQTAMSSINVQGVDSVTDIYLQAKMTKGTMSGLGLATAKVSFPGSTANDVTLDLSKGSVVPLSLPVGSGKVNVSVTSDVSITEDKEFSLTVSSQQTMVAAKSGALKVFNSLPFAVNSVADSTVGKGGSSTSIIQLLDAVAGRELYVKAEVTSGTVTGLSLNAATVSFPGSGASDVAVNLSAGTAMKVILPAKVGATAVLSIPTLASITEEKKLKVSADTRPELISAKTGAITVLNQTMMTVDSVSSDFVSKTETAISTITLKDATAAMRIALQVKMTKGLTDSALGLAAAKVSFPGSSAPDVTVNLSNDALASVLLPVGVKDKVQVSFKTEAGLVGDRAFNLSAATLASMSGAKVGVLNVYDALPFAVSSVADSTVGKGGSSASIIQLNNAAAGRELYVKAEVTSGTVTGLSLNTATVSFPGSGASDVAVNLSAGTAMKVILPAKVGATAVLSIPTLASITEEKKLKVSADMRPELISAKTGAITVLNQTMMTVDSVSSDFVSKTETAISTITLKDATAAMQIALQVKMTKGLTDAALGLAAAKVSFPGSSAPDVTVNLSNDALASVLLPTGFKDKVQVSFKTEAGLVGDRTFNLSAATLTTMAGAKVGVINVYDALPFAVSSVADSTVGKGGSSASIIQLNNAAAGRELYVKAEVTSGTVTGLSLNAATVSFPGSGASDVRVDLSAGTAMKVILPAKVGATAVLSIPTLATITEEKKLKVSADMRPELISAKTGAITVLNQTMMTVDSVSSDFVSKTETAISTITLKDATAAMQIALQVKMSKGLTDSALGLAAAKVSFPGSSAADVTVNLSNEALVSMVLPAGVKDKVQVSFKTEAGLVGDRAFNLSVATLVTLSGAKVGAINVYDALPFAVSSVADSTVGKGEVSTNLIQLKDAAAGRELYIKAELTVGSVTGTGLDGAWVAFPLLGGGNTNVMVNLTAGTPMKVVLPAKVGTTARLFMRTSASINEEKKLKISVDTRPELISAKTATSTVLNQTMTVDSVSSDFVSKTETAISTITLKDATAAMQIALQVKMSKGLTDSALGLAAAKVSFPSSSAPDVTIDLSNEAVVSLDLPAGVKDKVQVSFKTEAGLVGDRAFNLSVSPTILMERTKVGAINVYDALPFAVSSVADSTVGKGGSSASIIQLKDAAAGRELYVKAEVTSGTVTGLSLNAATVSFPGSGASVVAVNLSTGTAMKVILPAKVGATAVLSIPTLASITEEKKLKVSADMRPELISAKTGTITVLNQTMMTVDSVSSDFVSKTETAISTITLKDATAAMQIALQVKMSKGLTDSALGLAAAKVSFPGSSAADVTVNLSNEALVSMVLPAGVKDKVQVSFNTEAGLVGDRAFNLSVATLVTMSGAKVGAIDVYDALPFAVDSVSDVTVGKGENFIHNIKLKNAAAGRGLYFKAEVTSGTLTGLSLNEATVSFPGSGASDVRVNLSAGTAMKVILPAKVGATAVLSIPTLASITEEKKLKVSADTRPELISAKTGTGTLLDIPWSAKVWLPYGFDVVMVAGDFGKNFARATLPGDFFSFTYPTNPCLFSAACFVGSGGINYSHSEDYAYPEYFLSCKLKLVDTGGEIDIKKYYQNPGESSRVSNKSFDQSDMGKIRSYSGPVELFCVTDPNAKIIANVLHPEIKYMTIFRIVFSNQAVETYSNSAVTALLMDKDAPFIKNAVTFTPTTVPAGDLLKIPLELSIRNGLSHEIKLKNGNAAVGVDFEAEASIYDAGGKLVETVQLKDGMFLPLKGGYANGVNKYVMHIKTYYTGRKENIKFTLEGQTKVGVMQTIYSSKVEDMTMSYSAITPPPVSISNVDNSQINKGEMAQNTITIKDANKARNFYLKSALLSGDQSGLNLKEASVSFPDATPVAADVKVDLSGGNAVSVMLPPGVKSTIKVAIPSLASMKQESVFTLSAGILPDMTDAKSGTITVLSPLAITEVTGATVSEGETAISQVKLSTKGFANRAKGMPIYLEARFATAQEKDVALSQVKVAFPGTTEPDLIVDLSRGKIAEVFLPLDVPSFIEVSIPTIKDEVNNVPVRWLHLFADVEPSMVGALAGEIRIVNVEAPAVVDTFSIKAKGETVVTAKLEPQAADVVIPYEVKLVLSNLPLPLSLSRGEGLTPMSAENTRVRRYAERKTLRQALQNRGMNAIKVVASVSGVNKTLEGKQVCAFAINGAADSHTVIPAYFGYQKNGGWQNVDQSCAAQPEVVLKNSEDSSVGGEWQEDIKPAAGTASYTLQTRLGFKMNDPRSAFDIEHRRAWQGEAKNQGAVNVELIMGTTTK